MTYPGTITQSVSLAGATVKYTRNVSNGANTTSCVADVDTTLPLIGNGGNNFVSSNVTTGKLSFDAAFNGNKGGLIVDNLANETDFIIRMTVVNTGAQTTAVFKLFLVFDKTVPGTGVTIKSSPVNIRTTIEQALQLAFFGDGIEAIYLVVETQQTRTLTVNGLFAIALETQP